jgi:twitching motility protein PilT
VALKTTLEIITRGFEIGASDIHITINNPPIYRVNGRLMSIPGDEPLSSDDTRKFGEEIILNKKIRQNLEEEGQADFSYSLSGIGRLRVNIYIQRGSWAAAIRIIQVTIPGLSSLGLPPIVQELAMKERGLILVTGATGSGKSTTMAAMIDLINHHKTAHILTLEDPIEYLHRHGTCIINQREVGSDTISFAQGLRAGLRQDPDIIMVGEMRDLETISIAMTAAETGHLVMASLHSGSADQAIERVVDVFPPHQQAQVRIQLATSLQGIISQQLIPSLDGNGRIVAAEILINNPAIKNLIRENKIHQIYSAIQTGGSFGMITMDKAIKTLFQQKKISQQELSKRLTDREGL